MKTPEEIVTLMMNKDHFSQWMGIEILGIDKGHCKLQSDIHDGMLNGFHIAHGGISYSLSDSAMAFAANSHGNIAVSIETSITHLKSIKKDDRITVETEEVSKGNSIGVYRVTCWNQSNEIVSKFTGTVSFSKKNW